YRLLFKGEIPQRHEMDSSPDKPEYFANGDFEDAVSSIIASPRRGRIINGLPSAVAARMYEMSDKQRDYYKKCFGQLMKAVQGSIDYESAVWGGDTNVVHFFRKSQLETEVLSRVWAMADVNADGWLDLAEFSVAMHLIVLHVKGGLEVPECLPTHLRPPLTCPRSPPPTPTWSHFDESSSSSTATVVHSHNPSSSVVSASFHAPPPPHSQSAEALHLQQKIETPVPLHFSDVPPLLVDGRPTAIRTSQPIVTAPTPVNTRPDTAALLLSLKTPMGPPPQPPPRPANRGHGRSASLDLKAMSTVHPIDRVPSHPSSSVDSPDCPPSSSTSAFRPMSSSLHATTSAAAAAAGAIPAVPARPGRSATSLVQQPPAAAAAAPPTAAAAAVSVVVPPSTSSPSSSSSSNAALTSPPTVQPRRQCAAATQTEEPYISREDVERFIKDFVSRRDDLLGAAPIVAATVEAGRSDVEKWAGRCEALRVQNSELEKERATLAQVRIQLELRLQELQLQPGGGAMQQQQLLRNGCGSSTGGVSARPTNL
ncbi:reps-1, partial [Pristionchus pacificus]